MAYTIYPGVFIRRGDNRYCSYEKKDYIIRLHSLFNSNLLNVNTSIKVIDSHRAFPYYNKTNDEIVIDTHFFDILKIATAVLLSDHSEYIDALADYCAADFFICKDDIDTALKYAHRFATKKADIAHLINSTAAEANKHVNRQLLFVLFHEQGHGLLNYDKEDERFIPFRYYFNKEYSRLSEVQRIIHSVDLSSIKEDLDKIDKKVYEEDFNYSEADFANLSQHSAEFLKVVLKGISLLDVENSDLISKEHAIYYACDCYVKGGEIKFNDPGQYEPECLADGYTLQRLVSCQFGEESVLNQLEDTVFAYFSCLLTMDMISCVNDCVMNIRSEGYTAEDLVWNRLRMEREMLNSIIKQYAFRKPFGFIIAKKVFAYAERLINQYHVMYARFCDRIFSVEHPDENTPYYPCGSAEYEKYYAKIHALLTIDHVDPN